MIQQVNFSIDIMENGKWRIENEEQKMTTQASPASIKSRFACKAQPQMQPYRMVRRASRSRRSDRAFHARHEIGHGIAVSVKSRDMRVTFYTPTQRSWSASGGIAGRFLRDRPAYIGGIGYPL